MLIKDKVHRLDSQMSCLPVHQIRKVRKAVFLFLGNILRQLKLIQVLHDQKG